MTRRGRGHRLRFRRGLQEDGTWLLPTPRWAVPLLEPAALKGAHGGRSSGKSHFYAERIVERHVIDPHRATVCIREVQRSLKYSAKRLIDIKIRELGVSHLFRSTNTEIRNRHGDGLIIFQGMQDHTADSIKSLEAFDEAWFEEAQRASQRSIDLLLPTIRKPGSEVGFTWNPDQNTDPVDKLLRNEHSAADPNIITVSCNYTDNPFLPDKSREEAERWLRRDPDTFPHVWLGEYNTKSDDQVLSGKWTVDEFKPGPGWDGPYYGGDWGFSTDPTTLLQCYVYDDKLYVYREEYGLHVETVEVPKFYDRMEGARKYIVRADNARPEIISHLQRHGYPRVKPVEKWPGSVEDGISTLRGFEKIVIHPTCTHTIEEARLWKYKRDRLTEEVLPVLIDKHNHCWDAVRYAIAPLVKRSAQALVW